jgi:protease-4
VTSRSSWFLAVLALLGAVNSTAFGQIPARSGAPTPGKSLTSTGDADAVVVNPAGLALLPARELRAQWAGGSERPDRGFSFGAAMPLLLGLSAGARADLIRPADGPDRTWLSAALAYTLSDRSALGLSAARSYADDPSFAGQWGFSVGGLYRPHPVLGFGGLVRNFNGHRNSAGVALERSYEVGLLLRPTGTRVLEIALDATRLQDRSTASPRLTVGVAVPGLGRLRTEAELEREGGRRSFTAAVGLEVGLGSWALGGGGWAGARSGYFAGVASRKFLDTGVEASRHYVKIRLEGSPTPRGHVKLLRGLWKLASSREVAGVLLHLKGEPAGSAAHAEELGDALRMLRSRGKKAICHLEDAGVRALHVCSQADRIYTLPAGGVRFAGLKSQYVYFGGLLGKLGVRADFVRVAEHKTAPEQFLAGPSPTAAADHQETLRELEKTILSDIGGGRKISLPELKDRVARGPFTSQEARAAGLIDGVAHDDELDGTVAEVEGRRVPLLAVEASPALTSRPSEVMGSRDRVAIVYLDGDMIDGRSRTLPLVGNRIAGSYTIAAALKQAREDSRVRAVVLRLETPGGSSLAADVLWREVTLTARAKPVIASMGGMAASAGYYVASAAGRIFANRSTVTGSIGIYYGKVDLEGLAEKLGVNLVTYRTAPRADVESIFRPFTDDERQELGRKVKQFYNMFIDRVSRGRHLSAAEVDAVARGKVWTGEQAQERRLVDRIGGLREAVEEARSVAGLPADCPVVELPEQPRDLLSLALQLAGLPEASAEATPPLPPDLLRLLRQLAPLTLQDAATPQARLEGFPEFP